MDLKKLLLSAACLAILNFSSLSEGAEIVVEPKTWAFDEHYFDQQIAMYSQDKSALHLKNFDFGPFGASKMSLNIKTVAALESCKKTLSIYFDNTVTPPAELRFDPNSNGTKENILTFDVNSPDGVHDVYISIPSNVKSSDFSSVQFYTGTPPPGQWYYLISQASARPLTICGPGDYACHVALKGEEFQKFRFEEVHGGGYKMVTVNSNKVLEVIDGATLDHANVGAKPFTGMPYQVWYIQAFDSGFRFRPKHSFEKCLNIDSFLVDSSSCNGWSLQTWYFVKAC